MYRGPCAVLEVVLSKQFGPMVRADRHLVPLLAAALLATLPGCVSQPSDSGATTVHFSQATCTGRWIKTTPYATAVLQPATAPSLWSLVSLRSPEQVRSFVQRVLTAPLRASWSSMQLQSKNAVIRDNNPTLDVIEELSVTLSPSARSVAGLQPESASPSFEYSLGAVQSRQPVVVRCMYKSVNLFYPTMLLLAVLMWMYASKLAQSALFYYTSGLSFRHALHG